MINRFLQFLQYEKKYSFHTVLAYRIDLWQFCGFLNTDPQNFSPEPITSQTIQQWILTLTEEGISARSVSRKISTLKSFWKFLAQSGTTDKNPLKKIILPKTKKQLPAFYKKHEMDKILSGISGVKGFRQVRDHMIIDLFYQAGLRVSELVALTDKDMDLAQGQIRVTGKRDKERIIPLGRAICNSLKSYQQIRDETICSECNSVFIRENGKSMYNKAVYNIIHKNMTQVSTLHKQSPHVLRHTFATTLLNNGADINAVKKLLGHSSLATTQVYTHVSFSELNNTYKQAHPRALKKGGK